MSKQKQTPTTIADAAHAVEAAVFDAAQVACDEVTDAHAVFSKALADHKSATEAEAKAVEHSRATQAALLEAYEHMQVTMQDSNAKARACCTRKIVEIAEYANTFE